MIRLLLQTHVYEVYKMIGVDLQIYPWRLGIWPVWRFCSFLLFWDHPKPKLWVVRTCGLVPPRSMQRVMWNDRLIIGGQEFDQLGSFACFFDSEIVRSRNRDLSLHAGSCHQDLHSDRNGLTAWSSEVRGFTRLMAHLLFVISWPPEVEIGIAFICGLVSIGIFLSSIFGSATSFRSCFNLRKHRATFFAFFHLYAFSST